MDKTPQAVTLITSGEQAVLCTAMLSTPQRLTPTGKISHAKTRVYAQRYRKDWEHMTEFKEWLTAVPFQPTRAFCLYCKKNLHAHRLSLLKHTCTMKHQRAALMYKQEKKEEKDDTPEIGGDFENEEDIEYVVEKLDTDEEEESMETQEDIIEIEKREIDQELCAQLQSDDENSSEPVIKKIKLSEEKCRDPLAEAMAHVHNEYLEEVDDQNNVQMEMVIESTEADTSVLSDSVDNMKEESLEVEKTVNHPEVKIEKKLMGKILEENGKGELISISEPILDTTYETNIATPTQNNLNFVPIMPNNMKNKTVTLMCGSKAFKLTGGQFQPGTQYVLTKLKGKPATLMPIADSKKTAATAVTENKIKASESSVPSTSQSPAVPSTSTPQPAKTPVYKKTAVGKNTIRSSTSKKLRISTYVVDTTKGVPIIGLQVSLYKLLDGKWTFLNESNTAADGHCVDLLEKINFPTSGRYKLHFDVDKYFILRKIETMFPFIEIVFDVKNPNGHYHMPLLLSPFGYSTYRGT